VLFIISALCISPYGMASHLGSYYALLDAVPSSYPAQDTYKAMHSVYDNTIYESTEKWVQCYKEISQKPELIAPHKGETLSWDLQITGLFIIVNFIYYLLWEWIFRASLGKFLCGLTVASDNNQPTTEKEIIKRCFLLLLLMIAAVGLRFTFDINYYMTILLFFLIVDTSVIIKGKSLIDIMTNTYITKRKIYKNENLK
ncbi:hypothetical protein GUI34_31780, partial [Escherichia coli]|nr:hypothetical protein [Escherichia coli]